uniref:Uncharacterized protein n=1 Tax=Candidatus Kentrum sp. SD TaxID=2126332 RepID=A0A450YSE3_9GAMM|nr:MAG: hypothetical protein BECKSD772F_GA0070984_10464 [Candidatus Kentron sp. SD]VFK44457.1 MAG: hypothetical protein BECKSD772E_GA0070983_10384 [Candidatus Kentron sp. SD]VFK81346.1 MAG: hypothetical protein BECKSD772D_GA0070982_13201 [Candidatus Kentron sp. SD]
MSDMAELHNANHNLKYAVEAWDETEKQAKAIFEALHKFFYYELDSSGGQITREWLLEKYWELIKKKIQFVAKDITEAKEEADYSEREELECLKEMTTDFLKSDYDLSEEYASIIGEEKDND